MGLTYQGYRVIAKEHVSDSVDVPVLAIEYEDGQQLELRHEAEDVGFVALVTEQSVCIIDCLEGGERCSRS